MLRILNFEEIQTHLLKVPELLVLLEKRAPGAFEAVNGWLKRFENILENNRLQQAALIAGLRGFLANAARGLGPELEGAQARGGTRRALKEAAAREVIRKASEIGVGLLEGDAGRFEEADVMARKMITMADFKGLIPKAPDPRDHTGNLKAIWKSIQKDKDLEQAALHLVSLIGPRDALVILDRGITRDIWAKG